MAERKTIHQLEAELDDVRIALGINARGRVFRHIKSGAYYAAVDVGINEADMVHMVVYHPLSNSRVRFHRPFTTFTRGYEPVQYSPD